MFPVFGFYLPYSPTVRASCTVILAVCSCCFFTSPCNFYILPCVYISVCVCVCMFSLYDYSPCKRIFVVCAMWLCLFSAAEGRTQWHNCRLNDTFQRQATYRHKKILVELLLGVYLFICVQVSLNQGVRLSICLCVH